MWIRGLFLLWAFDAGMVLAQPTCPPTPTYSPCDLVFELSDAEAAAHPNPYWTVDFQAEFRSPRHHTFLMPAFWDGGRRMVIRFTPTEAGDWDYRISGNIERLTGHSGKISATDSESPGFIQTANVHHFAYTGNKQPHLWMGDTCLRLAFLPDDLFHRIADARAKQKFNHMRGLVLGASEEASRIFPRPDTPDPAHFRRLDEHIRYLNRKEIIADLVLGDDLAKLFPNWPQRERYIRYLISRYSAMNITWQGLQQFESYENGRELLKEIGLLLKKMDPYQHLRSTDTMATSAPLLADGWMNYVTYRSADDELGAIEHQLYPVPFVNLSFGQEDSGAGKSDPLDVETTTFRHRLWNAAMNGQYVTYSNTGSSGGGRIPIDARYLDAPGAKQMTAWFDFFSANRHWELEPFFDVEGGRAVALEEVEYIVYIEKPSLVEVQVEKHGYNVTWFNPIDGTEIALKDFKGEKFAEEPPDKDHDWVLHISREGRKQSMLRSYKFESRPLLMQEVEQSSQKLPFEIQEPSRDTLTAGKPTSYSALLKRETRGTRRMMWLWTGEVPDGGQGYRVLGTGPKGAFTVPSGLTRQFPTILILRLTAMNANGKVYSTEKPYQLTK